MKVARIYLLCVPALLLAMLAASGCSSVQKRMGGTPAAPAASAAPKPRLAASASGLKLSTNNVTAQPAQPAAAARIQPEATAKAKPAVAATSATAKPATEKPATEQAKPVPEDPRGAYRLRAGDSVIIFLRGIPPKDDELQDIVDEGGRLNLPYIGIIEAAGRTTSQLEQDIQKAYLDQQIYKNISVSVVLPAQYFFVRGEVKLAGRFPLVPGTTLLQSIASAGGYNDFADPRGVKIIRGEKALQFDAKDLERHPEKDVVLAPGDVVVVPRSLF